jgi:hypothetical protein
MMVAGLWVGGRGVYHACAAHETAVFSPDGSPARRSPQAGDHVRVVLLDGLTVEGTLLAADHAALEHNAGDEARLQRVRAEEVAELEPADEDRAEFGEVAMRVVTLVLLVTMYVSIVAFQFLY